MHSNLKHLITHQTLSVARLVFFSSTLLFNCHAAIIFILILYIIILYATKFKRQFVLCILNGAPNAGIYFFLSCSVTMYSVMFPPNVFNVNANTNCCRLNAIEIEMWCNRTYDWVRNRCNISFQGIRNKSWREKKKLQNIQLYEKRGFIRFRNVYPFPQSVWLNRWHLYMNVSMSRFTYFNRFLMHPTLSNEGVKKWKTKSTFFSVRSFC